MKLRLFNHEFEFTASGRNRITTMKLYRRPYYRHLVWWKFSFLWGQPHLEPVRVCSHCECVEGPTTESTMEEYEARA